jgi:hypothetical protein
MTLGTYVVFGALPSATPLKPALRNAGFFCARQGPLGVSGSNVGQDAGRSGLTLAERQQLLG